MGAVRRRRRPGPWSLRRLPDRRDDWTPAIRRDHVVWGGRRQCHWNDLPIAMRSLVVRSVPPRQRAPYRQAWPLGAGLYRNPVHFHIALPPYKISTGVHRTVSTPRFPAFQPRSLLSTAGSLERLTSRSPSLEPFQVVSERSVRRLSDGQRIVWPTRGENPCG